MRELQPVAGVAKEYSRTGGLHCDVLPIDPFRSEGELQSIGRDLALPFAQGDTVEKDSKLLRVMSGERKKAEKKSRRVPDQEGTVDALVAEAIQSISFADYKRNIMGSSKPSSLEGPVDHYSPHEK